MNTEETLTSILRAQCMPEAVSTTIKVRVGDTDHQIHGKSVKIIQLGVPNVTLFSKDSTPQKTKIAPTAKDDLAKALQELVEGGKSFYTELRPDWTLPAFFWTKA